MEIIEYNESPNATTDEKIRTLKESTQRVIEAMDNRIRKIEEDMGGNND